MVLIAVNDLWKSYRWRGRSVEALRGLSLSVAAGECFGLLGPNGAGKTTLLRILATLLLPERGSVTIAGVDLRRAPERIRRTLGYVGQRGNTDIQATVREDLMLQAYLYGLRGKEAERRIVGLLEQLELADLASRPVGTLSGGQRRRLDLALGLVHTPPLLLLDEPTLGLDPANRRQFWNHLLALRAQGTTILLTTHYLDEADQLCTRLAIIDQGRILASGSPAQLKRESAHETLILTLAPSVEAGARERAAALLRSCPCVHAIHLGAGEEGELSLSVEQEEGALPGILRLLEEAGFSVERLVLQRPSLDEVFLRYSGRSLREAAASEAFIDSPTQPVWKGK